MPARLPTPNPVSAIIANIALRMCVLLAGRFKRMKVIP
jgi:hypothetical protein